MSEENSAFQQIQQHRDQIDELDQKIVALLNERAGHSLAIRALKPGANMGLFDPKREEEIFKKVEGFNEGPLYNDYLREIYSTILKVMKETPSV
jgi:chorismate mutase